MEEIKHKKEITNSKNKNYEKTEKLPVKEFKLRNSLLTDLLEENVHLRTIYHISLALCISCFVTILVEEYFNKGSINMGKRLIAKNFGKLYLVFLIWLLYTLLPIAVFYIFNLWAIIRIQRLPPKATYLKVFDGLALLLCATYYVSSFQFASMMVSEYRLPVASAAIICLEQIRYLMKVHSFLRHNCEKVLKYKPHSDQVLELPSLSKFLYFLFVPTLVYQDEYPRTKAIKWKCVLWNIMEIILLIFSLAFIMEKVVTLPFKDDIITSINWEELVVTVLKNAVSGIMIYVIGFYLLLHVVQNFFAELLRFGDRLFYQDWWTSTSYLGFFRKWNIIVGDWLYQYIYKDIYEIVIPNKYVAKFTVFIVSAAVHEWVLFKCFGFFLPVLFAQMLISACLTTFELPRSNILNVLVWYSLLFGTGINVTLYGSEYYLRSRMIEENNYFANKFVPQIFFHGR